MRPMNEIEIELPQIVLDRADAAYAQIRQQAAQDILAFIDQNTDHPGLEISVFL